MSLVDKHPDHDPDCDDAQGATSRFGGRDLSRIVSKKPSEILRERRQRMRRRYLTTAGVVLALALSAVYVWGPFHSPHKPKLRSQGYTGTHIDTGRPSPKWANGTDIAWKLDHGIPSAGGYAGGYAVMKNGDQVFIVHELYEVNSSNRIVLTGSGVISLDVSGAKPAIQWEATLPRDPSLRVETRPVLVGEDLFIGEHRLDPATGAASPAPWAGRNQDGQDNPNLAVTIVITSRNGVVIACSRRICSGWEKEDGEWTMRWERDSTPTPLEDYQDCPECGEGTWVILNDRRVFSWGPAPEAAPQGGRLLDPVAQEGRIINTQTGEVRSLYLDKTAKFDQLELHSTANGWVVADSKTDQATVFASDGRPLESFAISASAGTGDHKATLPIGGQTPTSAQLRDFLTTGEAPWAEGLLRALATTADNGATVCDTLSFTPTGSDRPSHESVIPWNYHIVQNEDGQCFIGAMNPTISKDHSIIRLKSDNALGDDFTIDMYGTSLFHTSGSFKFHGSIGYGTEASAVIRVYDDLVLVIHDEGVTAFTPRWS